MSYVATRRIQFCAGHRVLEHGSKCRNLHGHNYVAMIHARPRGGELDRLGMVIDFSVLKAVAGGWIDQNWDHGFILHHEDKAGARAIRAFQNEERSSEKGSTFRQKLHVMPNNPTAENMAQYLMTVLNEIFLEEGHPIEICKVELWETENCMASVELPTGPVLA